MLFVKQLLRINQRLVEPPMKANLQQVLPDTDCLEERKSFTEVCGEWFLKIDRDTSPYKWLRIASMILRVRRNDDSVNGSTLRH